MAVTCDMLVGVPFTGGAMNPARALGPAVAAGYLNNMGVYWVGPLLGAVVVAVVYEYILRPECQEAATTIDMYRR